MTQTTEALITNRNVASGRLRTLDYLGVNDVARYADGAARSLALAAAAHATILDGTPPDDAEYLAGMALVAAAQVFVSAAQAAQGVVSAPINWCPKGSPIADALAGLK
jgi:acetyl/propionyl-CoA carboxylase alpha subunit